MSAPAGWYDDGRGAQRWWDGAAWTEHVASAAPQPGTASGTPSGRRRAATWAWLAAGAGVLALAGLVTAVAVLAVRHAGPIADARTALAVYDSAWLNVDCEALKDSTTASMRYDWGYESCDVFEGDARGFDQASRDFTMTIDSTEYANGVVTVHTTEVYQAKNSGSVVDHGTYTVVEDYGTWRIDEITFDDDKDDATDA